MKLSIEMVRGEKRDRDRGGPWGDRSRDRDRGGRRRSRSPIRDRRRSPSRCVYCVEGFFSTFLKVMDSVSPARCR